MGGGGSAPTPQPLYQQELGAYKAAAQMAPQVYGAEAQYDPQYAALNLSDMSSFLEGSPGTSTQVPYTTSTAGFIDPQTGQFVAGSAPPGPIGMGGGNGNVGSFGGAGGVSQWQPFTQQTSGFNTVTTPGSSGYMGLVGEVNQQANQQATQSQMQQASGNMANLQQLGPGMINSMMAADPTEAALVGGTASTALQGLQAGYNLTPAQMTQVNQSVAQGQASRGMGYGPADVYGQAMGVSQYGTQLYQQRLQNAQMAAGLQGTAYTMPAFNSITQTPQQYGSPYLQQGYGISSSVGPKLFGSQFNAQTAADTALNSATSNYNAQMNNSAAMTGAGVSAGVGLSSAMALGLATALA